MVSQASIWQAQNQGLLRKTGVKYRFLDCSFDQGDGRIEAANGQIVHLRPQVARLLQAFLDHPGQVLDRERLCRSIWDEGTVIDFESGLAAVLRELRRAFGDLGLEGDLIETIPRRGCRLNLSEQAVQAGAETAPGKAQRPPRHPIWPLLAAAVAILVTLAVLVWWRLTPAPPSGPTHALAILPFEQLADRPIEPEHAGLLMADYLLAELWPEGLEDVALIGRTSLLAYAGREDVAAAVAADLGVNLLIEGSISRVGENWRVDVRLLEVPPGRVLWSGLQVWPADQPLPVAESTARLVEELRANWQQQGNAE
jgi:DNA-binding winged helix-turn-helix (wHTH) protein/TolB-like protein